MLGRDPHWGGASFCESAPRSLSQQSFGQKGVLISFPCWGSSSLFLGENGEGSRVLGMCNNPGYFSKLTEQTWGSVWGFQLCV